MTKNQRKLKTRRDLQGNACYHCGVQMTDGVFPPIQTTATVDHLIPICKGGKDSGVNLVAACHKCNHKKGNSMKGLDINALRKMGAFKNPKPVEQKPVTFTPFGFGGRA